MTRLDVPAVRAVPALGDQLFLECELAARKRITIVERLDALAAVGVSDAQFEHAVSRPS